jgi:hypothetical protein
VLPLCVHTLRKLSELAAAAAAAGLFILNMLELCQDVVERTSAVRPIA